MDGDRALRSAEPTDPSRTDRQTPRTPPMASKAPTKTPAKKPLQKPKAKPSATRSSSSSQDDGEPVSSKSPASSKSHSARPSPSKSGSRPGSSKSDSASRPAAARSPMAAAKTRPTFVPRAMSCHDDDDVLMASGGGGTGFGRCGGRLLSSKLEQQLCSRLGIAGVVHSHSPRHYEVRYSEGLVAAYAPMIVLRGRGREGKSVVIEAVDEADAPILRKVIAFRAQYGQEFYVIMVAADEVLDEVALAAYDESCSATNVNTLIARLAE